MKSIGCAVLGLVTLLAVPGRSDAQPDPGSAIVTLDYHGGLPPPFPRKNKDPYLVIRADGQATVNDPFERKPRVEGKLSRGEIQALMDFIVRDNAFFSLDSNRIKAAIEAQLKKGHVTDLPTTYVWVKSGEREHEVKCYALFVYAEKFPDIRPLAQLRAIELRLNQLMNKLRGEADTEPALSPPRPDPHTQVTVPNVKGMSYTAARSTLTSLELKIKAAPSRPGEVIQRQSPAAGTKVAKGNVVTVYFGPPLVAVPDVVGMTYSAARSSLLGAGFAVKSVGNQKYRVKEQRPPAGAMVEAGTQVTVILGPVIFKSPEERSDADRSRSNTLGAPTQRPLAPQQSLTR